MNAPQRYVAVGRLGTEPHPNGQAVLFADIEPALRDAERFAWVLPIIDGCGSEVADARAAALAVGLTLGKTGCELVDFARERCPA